MKGSIKRKVIALSLFLILLQTFFYINYFYLLKAELIENWEKTSRMLVHTVSDKLSSSIEDRVSRIDLLVAKYDRMKLSADDIIWRISGDIRGIEQGAFYDQKGVLVTYESRISALPEFRAFLTSQLQKKEIIDYTRNSYGELYLRVKIPDFQDNVFRGFYVFDINMNTVIEDVYTISTKGIILNLLVNENKAKRDNMLRVEASVKDTSLKLILEEPINDVLGPAYGFLFRASIVGSISTLIVGASVIFILLRIFKPLDHLKSNVLSWNERKSISFTGQDEISLLSKTFEKLIESLEREKRVYMNIFNNSQDGMILTDTDGKVVKANKSFLERYGINTEDVIGKHMQDIIKPYSKGAVFIPEALLTLKDRKYIVNMHAVEIGTEEGSFVLYQLRDITDKKDLELALYKTSKLSIVGEIALSIAHQLNNPLASILTYAEWIHNVSSEERVREKAAVIIKQSLKSAETIERLLDIVRASESEQPKRINLYRMTKEIVEFMSHKARKSGVKLELSSGSDSNLEVICFPWKLEQILINIIENAIEASPSGKSVEVKLGREDTYIFWSVVDYGTGIAKEDIEKVFLPFYTTKRGGIGLGLSLVKRFVEDMNGKVQVRSLKGRTEFKLYIPGGCYEAAHSGR